MPMLSKYEDAGARIDRQTISALDEYPRLATEAEELDAEYRTRVAETKEKLRISDPKMTVADRENKAFLEHHDLYLKAKLAGVRAEHCKMRWSTGKSKMSLLQSFMSAHRAEAEFVRMGGGG